MGEGDNFHFREQFNLSPKEKGGRKKGDFFPSPFFSETFSVGVRFFCWIMGGRREREKKIGEKEGRSSIN